MLIISILLAQKANYQNTPWSPNVEVFFIVQV